MDGLSRSTCSFSWMAETSQLLHWPLPKNLYRRFCYGWSGLSLPARAQGSGYGRQALLGPPNGSHSAAFFFYGWTLTLALLIQLDGTAISASFTGPSLKTSTGGFLNGRSGSSLPARAQGSGYGRQAPLGPHSKAPRLSGLFISSRYKLAPP